VQTLVCDWSAKFILRFFLRSKFILRFIGVQNLFCVFFYVPNLFCGLLECKIYFAFFLRSKFILRFIGVQNLFCGLLECKRRQTKVCTPKKRLQKDGKLKLERRYRNRITRFRVLLFYSITQQLRIDNYASII